LQAILQNIDILYVQDLWTHNHFWIKGFNLIRKDIVSSNEKGICILIKNNILFNILDLSSFSHLSVELQGISMSVDNEPLVIINIYRHSNHLTPFVFYDKLIQFFHANFPNFIIMGDVNVHHTWWGCDLERDRAGKTLSRIIETYDLVITNDRASTILLPPYSRRSVIDLTLIFSRLASKCCTYTDNDRSDSDHFPIHTFICSSPSKKYIFAYKLNLGKKDTVLLSQSLSTTLPILENLISR